MGTDFDRLEEIRLELGLKQKEMAFAMGITAGYYSDIKAGKGKANLRKEHLISLREKYNVSPSWVLTGDGEPFLVEREGIGEEGPSENQIITLYNYTLNRRGIKQLNQRQEHQFKVACARCYVDNPQLKTLDQLYAASSIYLNFILQFPNIQI